MKAMVELRNVKFFSLEKVALLPYENRVRFVFVSVCCGFKTFLVVKKWY